MRVISFGSEAGHICGAGAVTQLTIHNARM